MKELNMKKQDLLQKIKLNLYIILYLIIKDDKIYQEFLLKKEIQEIIRM